MLRKTTPIPGESEFVPHSAKIDLSTWHWGEEGMNELVMKGFALVATEVLREVFEADPPRLWFPFEWSSVSGEDGIGGPPVTDPVMLYIDIPLGSHEDEGCVYAVSLESCIDGVIEGFEDPQTEGKIDDEPSRQVCRSMANRLRELADKLEKACQDA